MAIAGLGAQRYREAATLVRQAAGSYVAGEWTPGAESSASVSVVSAPATGKARDVLPEGARLSDARTFWMEQQAEPLRVGAAQTDGDVLVYRNIRYRVLSVQDWYPHGFIEVVAIRIESQDD